jgi:hypothetical protein
MCLMLYLAAESDVPLRAPTNPPSDLSVEEVDIARDAVRQWFSMPTVRFIGSHTGCSCGFPSVIAEEPIGYFDGMFDGDGDREADLRSVRALLALIHEHVRTSGEVQLYPVPDGDEPLPPKGKIDIAVDTLAPASFFLNERFLHCICRSGSEIG